MAEEIFGLLNDVYDLLSDKDRGRFAEFWKACEQTYGDMWTKNIERDLAVNVDRVPLYNNQRWLKHTFNADTAVARAAVYRTNQDLSLGINLSSRYLIKVSDNGNPPIEIDLRGVNPSSTTNLEIVDKINNAFGYSFVSLVVNGALIEFRSNVSGPTSNITFYPASSPAQDASAIVVGLDPLDLPISFPKFPVEFLLQDRLIIGIPKLQDKIHDNQVDVLLNEDVDYSIEFGTGIISFAEAPPEVMWAKNNLLNLETPYNNFGYLMDFYDKNTPGYLKAVKGLWFAYWTGPRPENMRTALYLLFGLPTASFPGTVTDISDSKITLQYEDESIEVFDIPTGLNASVAIGDTVRKFQPLVDGITVFDKVNSKGFLEREVGRFGIQEFLTEKASRGINPDTDETKALKTVEENTYLPQISVDAFISPDINLGNIKTFLKNIQPKSRTFLFQIIVGTFSDQILLDESLGLDVDIDVTPNMDSNPNTFAQQSDLDDAEVNDSTGIILDSDGMALSDSVEVEVYHAASLVDSFTVEA